MADNGLDILAFTGADPTLAPPPVENEREEGVWSPEDEKPEVTAGRVAGRLYHTVTSMPAIFAKSQRARIDASDPEDYAARPYVPPTPYHAQQIHRSMMDAANKGETWQATQTRLDSEWETLNRDDRAKVAADAMRLEEDGYDPRGARDEALVEHLRQQENRKREQLYKIESEFAMPDEYDRSSGFLEDLAGGLGTSVTGMAGTLAGGPALGAALIYEMMRGYKVDELEQLSERVPGGISPEMIDKAATVSAAFQTPLEALSDVFMLSKILKPAGTWAKAVIGIGESIVGEGATEFLQQYPDEFATIMALNPDAPGEEIREKFISTLPETTGEALYSGLVGAASGGVMTGTGTAVTATAQSMVDRLTTPTQRRVNAERLAKFQAAVDRVANNEATDDDIEFLRTATNMPADTDGADIVAEVTRRITLQEPVVGEDRTAFKEELRKHYEGTEWGTEAADLSMVLYDRWARRWADARIKEGEEVTPADFYTQAVQARAEDLQQPGSPLYQLQSIIGNPNFRKWFGDSVVTVDGKPGSEPLVVYHATGKDFDAFNTELSDLGSHFGTAKQAAHLSESFLEGWGGGDPKTYPVFLSIQNPIRLVDKGFFNTKTVVDQLVDLGVFSEDDAETVMAKTKGARNNPLLQDMLIDRGYDGVIYLNRREGVSAENYGDEFEQTATDSEFLKKHPEAKDSYIAFDPTQIKSAIGNRGTFSPTDPRILYQSMATMPEWAKRNKAEAEKLGVLDPESVIDLIPQMEQIGKLLQKRPELLREEGRGNPVRDNADYLKTFDLDTNCPRRMKYQANIDEIEKRIKRPMTGDELFGLAKILESYGESAPCIFCYVEGARRAFADALYLFEANRQAILDTMDDNPGITVGELQQLYRSSKSFVEGIVEEWASDREKGQSHYQFSTRLFSDPEYLKSESDRDPRASELERKARGYAQASSMSNAPKNYDAYRGQFFNMARPASVKTRGNVQSRAGWRFFSSTDAQIDYMIDYMQAMCDLAAMGDKAHCYTKQPWFVEVFGNTGMKFNMSVMAKGGVNGEPIVEDTVDGMAWNDAKRLRRKFKHAGTILVATNDEQIKWALDQDWVDMIIPFHRSGMTKEQFGSLGFQDYTRTQSDTWAVPDAHREKAPHLVYADHRNSKAKFEELVNDLGLKPRFYDFFNHKNYMKLVNDVVRPEVKQVPLKPVFDWKAAARTIRKWQKEGGYSFEQRANDAVVEEMMSAIESGRTMFQPDAVEPGPAPRGAIRNLFSDGPKIIQLFKDADPTTPIHEATHLWTRLLYDEGSEDYYTLAKWAGVDDARAAGGVDTWTTEELEKVAKGGEVYILEGKAPTPTLARVFARLKALFLEIYKSVKVLGVELTPEVRDVFDRLLTLDFERQADEFAELKDMLAAENQDPPITLSPGQTTWSEIEQEARRRVLTRTAQERKRKDKEASRALRAEAERVVSAYPPYQMLSGLRAQGGLDLDATRAEIGQAVDTLMKRIPGLVKRGGVDPVVFAAQYGYNSVGAMADDILGMPPKKDAVQAHFDSLWAEYQRGRDLENADLLVQILDEEFAILEELSGKAAGKPPKVKAMVRAATGQVDSPEYRQLVADLKRDAATARWAYTEGLRTGKMEKARELMAKQRERVRQIYQSKKDQADKVKIGKKLREYVTGSGRGTRVPPEYRGQIAALVNPFLGKAVTQPDLTIDQFLAAKAGAEPYLTSYVLSLLQSMPRQQVKTLSNGQQRRVPLTIDEWRHVDLVASSLARMGQMENAIIEEGKRLDFVERVDRIVATGYATHKKERPATEVLPRQSRKRTRLEELLRIPQGVAAELRKIEFLVQELDGWEPDGPAWHALFRPIAKGEDLKNELSERVARRMSHIFKGKDTRWSRQPVALSDGTVLSGGRGQAFMIALNSGNQGNYTAMTDDRGNAYTDAQILEVVQSVLTDEERQMVRDLWDLADSMYPWLNNVHRELTGTDLPKIGGAPETASAVETILNVFGETEQRYWPMRFDPKLSTKAGYFQSEKEARSLFDSPYGNASVEAGSRITRTGGKLPLLLELGAISKHFAEVIHDISYQIPIRNAQKIITHPAFKTMIGDTISEEHYNVLIPWLQGIARPGLGITGSMTEKMLLRVKRNTSVVGLGFNVMTTLLQPSAYTQTIAEIGELIAAEALVKFATSPLKWSAFVKLNSPMMRGRSKNWDRELNDMASMFDASALGKRGDQFRDAMFYTIGALDLLTAYPSWLGGYIQGLRKHNMTHEQAVEHADSIVRKTQGTGSPKDQPVFATHSVLTRLLTMFYSFFSTFYNRLADTQKQYRLGEINSLQVFRSALWNWIIPASLPGILGASISGLVGGDEEEPEEIAYDILRDNIRYLGGAVPIVRDLVGTALSPFNYTLSPIEGFGQAIKQLVVAFQGAAEGKDVGRRLTKTTITAAGYATGLVPSVQANRLVDGIWDLMEGETDNPVRLFYRPKQW